MSEEKHLTVHFSDGEVYSLPCHVVANAYANYHSHKWHNESTFEDLYKDCYESKFECLDYFNSHMSQDDWIPHATFLYKVEMAKEITHIDIG